MFTVYVLYSLKDKHTYVGCTKDIIKRFKEHNEGKSLYTKRDTYKLIYYEACENRKDAFTREKYLKTGMGKRYLKNRLKNFLNGHESR